ncbi:MAG: ABC transporter ATP-binding protein [Deltaproteobacteria bacterium]|nr:ABC transporter ATP-binding protein [Deltaproteobacteria bacterium]MBW1747783.1 ABC transporter ATP-binding protein [Deltaproteobacteria bacterium]MBW1825848.1 ABC transporter ATP-binding protein [Deltaproteobacteria bacterium]MBW1968610.1 ABC transporter ATP-binding protein [Deltaproteobacteria bacterium]MBW2155947.1 ABC transporter ATP-binding protein [Deltaproteobacteria bacterium]
MNSKNRNNHIILCVKDLKKYFPIRRGFLQKISGWVKAVDGVSFEIERGKTMGLVGESGCGKTTVARLILKLLALDQGKIIYQGLDISGFSEKEMRPHRKEMQIVFQDPFGSLNPRMTVGQSVEEGLRILGIKSHTMRKVRLEKLMEMVGMSPDSTDRYPHEFSGGQRQRIGIARALSVEPSFIICDEPISALDVSIQAQIINLLKDLQDQLGLSYLFISHDLNVVGYLCNTIAVMYMGQVMEYASAEEIFDNPHHPYTRSLLAAIPDSGPGKKLEPTLIKEDAFDSSAALQGCKYRSLCSIEAPRCRKEQVLFEKIGEGHFARCWKAMKK